MQTIQKVQRYKVKKKINTGRSHLQMKRTDEAPVLAAVRKV